MDKQQEKFPAQEAPAKNTDDAFVRVGHDGSPEMPQEAGEEKASQEEGSASSEP